MKDDERLKKYTFDTTKYKETCSTCGKTHMLYTQHDNDPEYYTNVILQCDCKDYVVFTLPVN